MVVVVGMPAAAPGMPETGVGVCTIMMDVDSVTVLSGTQEPGAGVATTGVGAGTSGRGGAPTSCSHVFTSESRPPKSTYLLYDAVACSKFRPWSW